MPGIKIKDGEPFEVALRRFKRACEKAGILPRLRQLEAYEKPTSKRKRKLAAAIKRWEKKKSRSIAPTRASRGAERKKWGSAARGKRPPVRPSFDQDRPTS